MARTTPAQKPRGEQSTIFRSGLAGTAAVMEAISGPNHPIPVGRDGQFLLTTWGRFRALSRPFRKVPTSRTARSIAAITSSKRRKHNDTSKYMIQDRFSIRDH